jgi:GNAT superfamily N-acetyltransferase
MTTIRTLQPGDARAVVDRIANRLADDARHSPLVNPCVDTESLYDTILHASNATWVAVEGSRVVGHLYGAVLNDHAHERAAWTGPDGVSFDDDEHLEKLVDVACASWRRSGATQHYSWTLANPARVAPWDALGYQRLGVRGVMTLRARQVRTLPDGMVLRAATSHDVERALQLDHVIDVAQGDAVAMSGKDRRTTRRELLELLEDPDVRHYVVEANDVVIAQAVTFPLPPRRGSFDATLHLSEVVVDPSEQGLGVASAMIDTVLERARLEGFGHVEAQWRVTNQQASTFWPRYGLTPTYVRLGRAVGSGE